MKAKQVKPVEGEAAGWSEQVAVLVAALAAAGTCQQD
jgi:hypothetical protein